jgi:hypothetical protein
MCEHPGSSWPAAFPAPSTSTSPGLTFTQKLTGLTETRGTSFTAALKNRSKVAVDYMMKKGFMNIWHMTDGWVGWNGKGLPVEK